MTLSRAQDVTIVGAGPSGSALACLLAERGVDVLLLDGATFPRAKPCGECVNPGGVEALRRVGLLDHVLRLKPADILGWSISTACGATVRGHYDRTGPGAIGICRSRLDASLVAAARQRGVRVREGVKVTDVRYGTSRYHLVFRGPAGVHGSFRTRFLVAADGLRSIVTRRLGLIRRAPRLRKLSFTYRMHGRGPATRLGRLLLDDGLTIGLAPVADHEPIWNLTVVITRDRIGSDVAVPPSEHTIVGFARRVAHWTEAPVVVRGPWTSGPFDWPVRSVVGDRLVLIGDAAGYYDPFTGQGIRWAVRSAELAAATIHESLARGNLSENQLAPYDRWLRQERRAGLWFQRSLEMLLSTQRLRHRSFGLIARAPSYADLLVRVAGDALPATSLLRLYHLIH